MTGRIATIAIALALAHSAWGVRAARGAEEVPRAAAPPNAFALAVDKLGVPKRKEIVLAKLSVPVTTVTLRPPLPEKSGATWEINAAEKRARLLGPRREDPLTGTKRDGDRFAEVLWNRGELRFTWLVSDAADTASVRGVIANALETGELVCENDGREVLIVCAPPLERRVNPAKGRQRLGLPSSLPELAIDTSAISAPWSVASGSTTSEVSLDGSGPTLHIMLVDSATLDIFFEKSAKDALEDARRDLKALEDTPPPVAEGAKQLLQNEINTARQRFLAAEAEYKAKGDPHIAAPFTITIRDAAGGRPRAVVTVTDKASSGDA